MTRALLAGLLFGATTAEATPHFDAVFADHAVLQRDRPVRLNGTATASRPLTLTLANQSITTTADATGAWSATLPPLPAGGPWRLTATDPSGTAHLEDIMIGDVFLCGGQSNMSYLTKYATNASNQLKTPTDPKIRFATIPIIQPPLATTKLRDRIQWRIAAPDTLGDSPAVCYYMAQDLKRAHNVTIGLIRSSLGGTRVESWLSAAALAQIPPYGERVAALQTFAKYPAAGRAQWQAHVENWWQTTAPTAGRDRATHDDSAWAWASLPGQINPAAKAPGTYFAGALWYRHTANITPAAARTITALDLGTLTEDATIWINGRRIGAREANLPGPWPLARGLLKPGGNSIAIRLLDHGNEWQTRICRDGCRWLTPTSPILLTPDWRYQIAARNTQLPVMPRAPWDGGHGLGTLYNGMIVPLAAYAFKGVVWYQGESNASDAVNYARLLPILMNDWRHTFADPNLPFVIVQLPAYGPQFTAPAKSDWAEIREVQRQTSLADPRTALIVTLDAGDRWDIHPAQKKTIGQRAARAMRSLAYADPITPGGPRPQTATRAGDDITITFTDTDGGLVTYASQQAIGFETCDPARACRFTAATAAGNTVTLPGANRTHPAFIRYAWANTPIVNLFGGADIPTIPFELAIP